MTDLTFRERPAAGDPEGLLVLHHGRGADEHDLLGLGDVLDPQRRLHVATPRAPLTLPGWPGYHWYVVPRVGYPDHDTFHAAYAQLAAFHDELFERTGLGPEQTVLGGFSMGSVMSYSLGLGPDRPAPAGILAFSGFIPIVDGWEPDLAEPAEHASVHRARSPRPGHGGRLRAPRSRASRGGRPAGRVPRVRRRAPHRSDPRRAGHAMARRDAGARVIGLGASHSPTEGGARMADSVYRVTEVIGVSSESWEAAARNAVDTAAKSVRDLRIAEVVRQDVTVAEGGIVNFRVRLAISFKYESGE